MHNKHLTNAGFYLLMVFAFFVAIYPRAAYGAAAMILLIWILDLVIFKEPEFIQMTLFYPIIMFGIFILAAWGIARVYGVGIEYLYLIPCFVFYLAVSGFVISGQQRKMIMWTFVGGVLLLAGLQLARWWSGLPIDESPGALWSRPSATFVPLAFCVLVSFWAEARAVRERAFFLMVSLPLLVVIFIALDNALLAAFLTIIFVFALVKDRRGLAAFGIVMAVMIFNIGGVGRYISEAIGASEFAEFLTAPLAGGVFEDSLVEEASFFGTGVSSTEIAGADQLPSFFIDLTRQLGPPALLLIVYIFLERARESFFKRRKVTSAEEKSYHLSVLMLLGALFVLNLYGPAFCFPNVVLAAWMLLGISEV
jgi:hypothetical protein